MTDNKVVNLLHKISSQLDELNSGQKGFMDLDGACKYLGTSASYLYKLTCARKIPYYTPSGKKIFFLKKDLDRFVLQGKHESDAELKAQIDNYPFSNKKISKHE